MEQTSWDRIFDPNKQPETGETLRHMRERLRVIEQIKDRRLVISRLMGSQENDLAELAHLNAEAGLPPEAGT